MLDDAIKTRLDNEINSEQVVLFMKGTPVFPQCGFSAATVGVLSHLGVKFRGINVLEDDNIRDRMAKKKHDDSHKFTASTETSKHQQA